jgi:hypothetical protein
LREAEHNLYKYPVCLRTLSQHCLWHFLV